MKQKLFVLFPVAMLFFVRCLLENKLPDTLPVSPFDSNPRIVIDAVSPDEIDSVMTTNTLQLTLTAPHNEDFMEYHYSISLSDHSGPEVYSLIANPSHFMVGALSETLPGQYWILKIYGNYRQNTLASDTIIKTFRVDETRRVFQFSPSIVTLSRVTGSQFYLDLILDQTPDTIMSMEITFNYKVDSLNLDSISILQSDSLYYFKAAEGMAAKVESHNSKMGICTLTCGMHSGNTEGIAGSGKIARAYFTARTTGTTSIIVSSVRLADIHNQITACAGNNAYIEILP
ncbi:MAG: hypothetical protein GF401_14995 [Chitinivibrionales bacterium]|nr:hypothetical protein [Chitinivibrionales bacterium]